MGDAFRAVPVAPDVHWVGAVDWGVRNFHGYLTSNGTTYNAFLVIADKVTLIDTVKPGFFDEMMARISSVIDPARIDYVISNHSEMDHSGCLPQTLDAVRPERVFASAMGELALRKHFHWDRDVQVVGTGDTLELGGARLRFVESRMLHWPDSMLTYLDGAGILFSNDVFGMHLATGERFADELEPDLLRREGAKYYANIILHLSPIVTGFLEKLPAFGLDIRTIAPDHGPIWRTDADTIVRWYGDWARQEPTRKAVVVYDSMWESTARMARAVGDGLTGGGAAVRLMPLGGSHRSDVVTELLDAGALLVGSPTINNQIYPTVADVMNYLKGLKPRNLAGATFGSYGWSGEAEKPLDKIMGEMGVELVREGLRVQYVPSADDLAACRGLGIDVAGRMLERLA
jgi:flavorubredoxin